MAIGLGKRYWVRVLKFKSGTLEECINFINKNKPKDNKEWVELEPIPNLKNNTCKEYKCSLVSIEK